jgi:hypothetical protein
MNLRGTQTFVNEVNVDVPVPNIWKTLKRAMLGEAGILPSWRLNDEQQCFEDDVSEPLDDHENWVRCADATPEQIMAFKYVYGLEAHFKLTSAEKWKNL